MKNIKNLINEVFYGNETSIDNAVLTFSNDERDRSEVENHIKEIKVFLEKMGIVSFKYYPENNKVMVICTDNLIDEVTKLMLSFGFEQEGVLNKASDKEDENKSSFEESLDEEFQLELKLFENLQENDYPGTILLDFDNTVREILDAPEKGDNEKRPPLVPEEVKVFSGVGNKLKQLLSDGWFIFGVTNQKGTLRRREFLPQEEREGSEEIEAAIKCGEVIKETLKQLGVNFPVFFAGDNDIYLYKNGSVKHVAGGVNAPKPSPEIAHRIKTIFSKPEEGTPYYMVGDYPPDDQKFSDAIGATFVDATQLTTYDF